MQRASSGANARALQRRREGQDPVEHTNQGNDDGDNDERRSVHQKRSADIRAIGGILHLCERNEADNEPDDVHQDDGDGTKTGHEDEGKRGQPPRVLIRRNHHIHERPDDDQRKDDKSSDPKPRHTPPSIMPLRRPGTAGLVAREPSTMGWPELNAG